MLPSIPTPTPSHLSMPMQPSRLPGSGSMMTPEGSLVVSITTPQGSGDTEHSSLRTVTDSAVPERYLGRDLDRLADKLRTYDQAKCY